MDDRKITIRGLEEKNQEDTEAKKRLFEKLGAALIQRIGDREPFSGNSGETPGGLLAEYRKLEKEIAESREMIKSFEAEIQRLKELEEEIIGKEGELSRLEKELADANVQLGKKLLEASGSGDFDIALKQQEEILCVKIDEQEKKLEEFEDAEGGLFSWLGKNARQAVSKGLLMKYRSDLQKLYRTAGEKYVSGSRREFPEGEAGGTAGKAVELQERASSLVSNLSALKGERRKIGEIFGAGGSPERRIHGHEKHIAHVRGNFSGIYFRFGALAAGGGSEELSPLLTDDDRLVLETAGSIASKISERELVIKKLNSAIGIDNEKVEIEKTRKAIQAERRKISAAEESIAGLEKRIMESERHIEELNEFIQNNGGISAI